MVESIVVRGTTGGDKIYITVLLFKGEILGFFVPSNDIGLVSVILSPFDCAQGKLREGSRFSNIMVNPSRDEILRHCVPQNDMNKEPVLNR